MEILTEQSGSFLFTANAFFLPKLTKVRAILSFITRVKPNQALTPMKVFELKFKTVCSFKILVEPITLPGLNLKLTLASAHKSEHLIAFE
jgi:hypothetical protein